MPVPLDPIAQRIVDAVVRHPWSTPGEMWEVSPTAAPQPPYWVKVMYVSPDGSEMVGLLPFGRRPLQEVIGRFRDAVEDWCRKTVYLTHWPRPEGWSANETCEAEKAATKVLGSWFDQNSRFSAPGHRRAERW